MCHWFGFVHKFMYVEVRGWSLLCSSVVIYFLRQTLSPNLKLTGWTALAGQVSKDLPVPASLVLEQSHATMPDCVYVWMLGSNSDPHAYEIGTSQTELSSQAHLLSFDNSLKLYCLYTITQIWYLSPSQIVSEKSDIFSSFSYSIFSYYDLFRFCQISLKILN